MPPSPSARLRAAMARWLAGPQELPHAGPPGHGRPSAPARRLLSWLSATQIAVAHARPRSRRRRRTRPMFASAPARGGVRWLEPVSRRRRRRRLPLGPLVVLLVVLAAAGGAA